MRQVADEGHGFLHLLVVVKSRRWQQLVDASQQGGKPHNYCLLLPLHRKFGNKQ